LVGGRDRRNGSNKEPGTVTPFTDTREGGIVKTWGEHKDFISQRGKRPQGIIRRENNFQKSHKQVINEKSQRATDQLETKTHAKYAEDDGLRGES